MADTRKTKAQLVKELEELRAQVATLQSERGPTERAYEYALAQIYYKIRGPVETLVMASELALDEMVSEEQAVVREAVRRYSVSAKEMLEGLQTLVAVSRLERGEKAYEQAVWTSFALDEIAKQAIASVQPKGHVRSFHDRRYGPEVSLVAPDELTPVVGNEWLISHVIQSMVSQQFWNVPRNGRILVELAESMDGHNVSVIASTYTPLDLDKLEWYRGREASVNISPDTLFKELEWVFTVVSLDKLAVKAHGGRIWVERTPQGGAAIHLTLPGGRE